MSHAVAIDQFEGPLGLLLELVERNKMPVTDIAVATITSQYLERIAGLQGLSPDELGEFLGLGSRLVYIKSLALLPIPESDEERDELRLLSEELADYQRYQAAARLLAGRADAPSHSRPYAAKLDVSEVPLPELSLIDLAGAFTTALRQLEPAKPSATVNVSQLSQAKVLGDLRSRLATGSFDLHDLLASLHDRLEVVVTFSALLELIRAGHGRVTQTSQFAPIMVEAS